jgi:hypothetical protein
MATNESGTDGIPRITGAIEWMHSGASRCPKCKRSMGVSSIDAHVQSCKGPKGMSREEYKRRKEATLARVRAMFAEGGAE